VERQNRVIKERARAIIQTMPYAGIPRKIRIALIQYVVYWLNNIPKSGQEHSPRDLISGEQKLDYEAVCRIPFGAYVQVHDDPTITNTCNLGPLEPLVWEPLVMPKEHTDSLA
jgi:hypothetical protein